MSMIQIEGLTRDYGGGRDESRRGKSIRVYDFLPLRLYFIDFPHGVLYPEGQWVDFQIHRQGFHGFPGSGTGET